jgi:hypothetical protein
MSTPLLITNADISGVLKQVYLKYRTQTFPVLTPILANIKKLKPGMNSARWGGQGVYFDAVLTRPVGMTFSPAGFFPPSAQSVERQANIGITRSYVTRTIDGLAIQGTASSESAFVALARKVMQEAMDAAKLGQQEAINGSGTGIKAIISSSADTTHFVATSPYGVVGAGQGGLLLDVGMYVAVRDTTGVTLRGKATITAAANSGDSVTVTLDAAIAGMVSTDIVVAGTTSDDAYNNSTNGLVNITNRGGSFASLHNITQASFPRWDATRMVAGTDTADASQPSEMDVWQLATLVANRSGKDPLANPDEFLMVTTPGVYRKLAESFLGQRRWDMADNVELKGGFKALRVCGLPCIQDFWVPAGTIYLIHLPSLLWVDLMDFMPLSYEGVGPWRFVAGRDAYEWTFGSYWNLGAIQRNSLGSITGYTDTIRYSFVQ